MESYISTCYITWGDFNIIEMKDNYCYYYMYMTVEITTLKYQARVINKDIDINYYYFVQIILFKSPAI
jgi:hypothetical protein